MNRPTDPAVTFRDVSHYLTTFEKQTTKMVLDDWIPLSVHPRAGGGYRIIYVKRWLYDGTPLGVPVPELAPVEKAPSKKRARKR